MFKNYFKVGIRNIVKYKTFSFINIFGLAVGIAVSLLIILMLVDQKSYDQFNIKKDRIYRVHSKVKNSAIANASSPLPLAITLKENYPIVENATSLVPGIGGDAIYAKGKYAEIRGFFADEQFFDVFSFELEEGNKQDALNNPNTMIITTDVAYKLFNDESAIGKTIQFSDRSLDLMKIDLGTGKEEVAEDWGAFIITGVIDLSKYKSHIKFDMLVSSASLPRLYQEGRLNDRTNNWLDYSVCYTYILLQEEASATDFQTALNEISHIKFEEFSNLDGIQLLARNLNDITPGRFVGNPITLRLPIEAYYILIILALIVLLSACLNYTNLSIARALTRAKEIGIRKVTGARRNNLIFQFLTESVLTALFSLIMAGFILYVLKLAMNGLWVSDVLNFDLTTNLAVYFIFLGFSIVVGLVAGIYPSLVLSGFAPLKALKNLSGEKPGKIGLRKALTVTQFSFSLLFIITSILVARQFRHIMDFEYGFDTHQVVNIPIQGNDYKLLQNEFASIPGVVGISACEFIPALLHQNGSSVSRVINDENSKGAEKIGVDPNFLDNMGLNLIAGQNLSDRTTSEQNVIISERAIKSLEFETAQEAIGQTIYLEGGSNPLVVIGVFEDFKFQNPIMGEGDKPLILKNQPGIFSFVNVKYSSQNPQELLNELQAKWEAIDPVHPFKCYIYDEQLSKASQWFGDLVAIVGFISLLAIVISCLGLLGMAIYSTERRVKEVGVRKVLGANGLQLVILLSKSFIFLLVLSIVIAAPLSYFANNLWLENFPNRVDFGVETIFLGSMILMVLGLLSIGPQTLRISNRNPVDSLRDE